MNNQQLSSILNPIPFTKEEFAQKYMKVTAVNFFNTEAALHALRQDILDLVRGMTMDQETKDNLSPAFKILGLGDCERDFVTFWEQAETLPTKEVALGCLFHSPIGQKIFQHLSETDRIDLIGPWVRPMLRLCSTQEFPKYALAALYENTSVGNKEYLMKRIEKIRKDLDVRIHDCYPMFREHIMHLIDWKGEELLLN